MNNLALVDAIPSHMVKWGTGRLPATEYTSASRQGDGLEVLDLGNCSLPFSAVQNAFLTRTWSHLRSLSLHSNPLAVTHPDYATSLQDSDTLPKLQIIDSKRIVQRKRKGEIQESKIERRRREKKEKKRMTGANARETTGTLRVWGETAGQSVSETAVDAQKVAPSKNIAIPPETSETAQASDKKRKRKAEAAPAVSISDARAPLAARDTETSASTEKKRKRVKPAKKDSGSVSRTVKTVANEASGAQGPDDRQTKSSKSSSSSFPGLPDPSTQRSKQKADDGKVETVAKSAGGVDLNKVFGKPQREEDDGGLGVGGW